MKKIKAVSLISGGLDSMLATKMMLDQGIDVEGINFFTGFCVEGHTQAIRNNDEKKKKRNNALWVAEQLGIKLHIIDVIEPYKDVLLNPKYGYGANMNPCLDCKIFMVKEAKKWALENNFDFIITGEVVGQRPMSQRKATMPIIQEKSGINDLLLRPLSALNLPETKPEIEGWVDRSLLMGISGRSRKEQMALADKYNIKDYATPAGGCCFLTDKQYSSKLVDLWKSRNKRDYEFDDIVLLKVGRHIRPKLNYKLIIGRDDGENNYLRGYKNQYIFVTNLSHVGSLMIIDGTINEEDENLIGSILARYSKGKDDSSVTINFRYLDGVEKQITVKPIETDQIHKDWYV